MIHEALMRLVAYGTLLRMAMAREHGLNVFQLLSVLLIGGSETGISIKGLREALLIPGSSLTFTMDSLEKRGYIKRTRNQQDRRQWLLFLTAKGKRFYAHVLERQSEAIAPSLEKFTEAERADFLRVADELTRAGGLYLAPVDDVLERPPDRKGKRDLPLLGG